jgi:predicted porin
LAGKFGTVFYGQWDTPYYYAAQFVGPIRGLNPFDNAVTGNPGFNIPVVTTQGGRATARADAVFIRRQGNSIQYWTPTWHGLSARLAAGLNESRTRASATEPGTSPWVLSALASYDVGPLGSTEVCLRSFARKYRALMPVVRNRKPPAPGWSRQPA